MKIVARCDDRVIVQVGLRRVAEVTLQGDVVAHGRVLGGRPTIDSGVDLPGDLADLTIAACEGCRSNYGPRGCPPGGAGVFQQFALRHGSYPWSGGAGWYCMGCSMPPR